MSTNANDNDSRTTTPRGSRIKSGRKRPPSGVGLELPPPDPSPSSPFEDSISDSFTFTSDAQSVPILVTARSLIRCKIREIGRGRYGTVDIMREPRTGLDMAVKRIRETQESQDFRYLEREVRACLRADECPYLVKCYGVMRLEGDVWICMELMDSSLFRFYCTAFDMKRAIPESVLGRIAHSALIALRFMVEELHLMHRDVKPSNMLVNSAGQVKLCDYGISGVMESQPAKKTIQAGCKPYMAIEIATGSHPYDKWKNPFEQLKQVVNQPAPKLPQDAEYSQEFRDFIETCLTKNYDQRPKYRAIMETAFIKWYEDQCKNPGGVSMENEILDFILDVLHVQSENEQLVLNRQLTGALKLSDMV